MPISYKYSEIDFNDKVNFPLRDPAKVNQYPILHMPNFVTPVQVAELQKSLRILKKLAIFQNDVDYQSNRYNCGVDPIVTELQLTLMDKVSDLLKTKIIPTSISALAYFEGGHFPPHTDGISVDGSGSEYSLLVPVDQKEIWHNYVEGEEFSLEIGDALLYSGLYHAHWRNEIQPGNFSHHVILFYKRSWTDPFGL